MKLFRSFVRAFAVFCLTLGCTAGLAAFHLGPPELWYLPPALTLIYLGIDILLAQRRP
jgi:hypothetical protein